MTVMDKHELFAFLDELRLSGKINMFESPRVLMEMYGMTKQEAKNIFIEWTEQFGGTE